MKNITRLVCIFLTFLLIFTLSGCGASAGSQIVFEVNSMPTTLDPQLVSSETEMLLIRNLYEGLMRKDNDGKIVPAAAQSYIKNGNTYTFTLKDNIFWSDGSFVTANDFKFAFLRAVDPSTHSPFAEQLKCINGASEILSGNGNASQLAITVKNEKTIEFSVNSDEDLFFELLCSPISMPCNEEFFVNSYGKYGRDIDSVLTNGSFSLRSWNTETNKITITRSKHYEGDFEAKTYSISLVFNDFATTAERLADDTIDGVFLNDYILLSDDLNYYSKQYISDTIWALTISEKLPADIRCALLSSVDEGALQQINNEFYEYSQTFLPKNSEQEILASIQDTSSELTIDEIKTLFSNSVKKDFNGKLPSISILYYDNAHFKQVATSLASHWQKELGAFINIEPISKATSLEDIYSANQYYIAIVPFSSEQPDAHSFYSQFSVSGKNSINNSEFDSILSQPLSAESANKLNKILTGNYTLKPLYFGSKVILMNNSVTNVLYLDDYGKIDFAFAENND